jgi:hypothetical protein
VAEKIEPQMANGLFDLLHFGLFQLFPTVVFGYSKVGLAGFKDWQDFSHLIPSKIFLLLYLGLLACSI